MATTLRVVASHASTSGLPEDACINVWHFRCVNTDPEGDRQAIVAGLDTFYNSLADLFTSNTMTGTLTFKFYDLQDDPPRTPIQTTVMDPMTLPGGDGLPTECSIVLSIEGAPLSGTIRARRRGRLFLGPFNTGVTTTVTGYVYVSPSTIGTILDAANELAISGFPNYVWAVFSPTTAGAEPWSDLAIEDATTNVAGGWVDNAFDTQRRRGTLASTRSTFDDQP